MEQRLSAALVLVPAWKAPVVVQVMATPGDVLQAAGQTSETVIEAPELPSTAKAAVPADQAAATGEDEAPWPTDETGEAAFQSTARENGEVPVPVVPALHEVPVAEDDSKAALPALDSLVQRIPADVRDVLEDLFRAKFTTVRQVPAKALNPR